jgi:hypothetical protein
MGCVEKETIDKSKCDGEVDNTMHLCAIYHPHRIIFNLQP